MPGPAIFRDTGQTLYDFTDKIYVCCPNCARCAHVLRVISAEDTFQVYQNAYAKIFHPRRLSCLHCGYTKTWEHNEIVKKGPHNWYFGQPLWLQTSCCGQTLWVLNGEHLDCLEHYVSARQRVKFSVPGQIRNQTMASRLPLWMKSAKNRAAVLQSLTLLKSKLRKI